LGWSHCEYKPQHFRKEKKKSLFLVVILARIVPNCRVAAETGP